MMIINSNSNEYYLDTLTPPETIQNNAKFQNYSYLTKKNIFLIHMVHLNFKQKSMNTIIVMKFVITKKK